MKYRDMPEGNDENPAYEMMLVQVDRGRNCVVIPLAENSTYFLHGEFEHPATCSDHDHWRNIRLAHMAYDAAQAEGEKVHVR